MAKIVSVIFGLIVLISAGTASAHGPEAWVQFDPSLGKIPESITTAPDGTLYFSIGDEIRTLDAEGAVSSFAHLPIAAFVLGLKVGPDDCVYAAGTSLDPSVQGAFVWRACGPGELEPFAELDHAGGPNDLAFLPTGNLLVTDPILGRIYRVEATGQASIWSEDALLAGNPQDPALLFAPQGANGIAVERGGEAVYVGNLDYGRILRIGIEDDGSASPPEIHAEDPRLRGADGLALDLLGSLFVAVNAQDSLVLVTPGGTVWPIDEGSPLDGPSSVVFGTPGRERRTLYIVSSAFSRAFGLQPGTPEPAILRQRVWIPGLSLF